MLAVDRHWPFLHRRHAVMESPAVGWTALAVTMACGFTFTPFAKSLSGILSPLSLLFVSEVLTLSFVALSFGLVPMLKQLAGSDRGTLRALLAVSILSGVFGPFLWFAGLERTTAVNAIFFGKIELVFLLVLASTVVHERITRRHAYASAVILFGVAMIALQGFSDGFLPAFGDVLIMASAFCYSLASCIFRRSLSHLPPQVAVMCRSLTAMSAFFLLSPFFNQTLITEVQAFPIAMVPILLGFAFLSRYLSTFAFYEAAERLPLSTIYPVLMLDVLGSAVVAHLLLGESLLWYHFVGGAFIVAGNLALHFLGVHENDQHLEQHAVERMAHR